MIEDAAIAPIGRGGGEGGTEMAAIAMRAGTIGTTVATRRPVDRRAFDRTVLRSFGALALAVAALVLLVAMLPGLPRVSSTDIEPRGLSAPSVVTSQSAASTDRPGGSMPAPAPAPAPAP
jgi:hypothetical protein